jgi:hypothetical protein
MISTLCGWKPDSPELTNINPATRSGWVTVKSMAICPPMESPTRTARGIFKASRSCPRSS